MDLTNYIVKICNLTTPSLPPLQFAQKRHALVCSKWSKITNDQYVKKALSDFVDILHVVRDKWKLQIDHGIDLICRLRANHPYLCS